jgi:archaeosortase B (VPXXXP-CTERM-specific)
MAKTHRDSHEGPPNQQRDAQEPRGIGARIRQIWANAAYRFVIFFLINLGIVAIVYSIITGELFGIVEGMMSITTNIEGFILGIFSSHVSVGLYSVTFEGFPVKIIEECTGIYEILIFTAAVMAFPTSLKKKGIGLAFGVPLMYLFNVIRILVLILIGRYYYSIFDFMHLYFWQVTLILMITSVWVLWILKVVNREKTAPSAGA